MKLTLTIKCFTLAALLIAGELIPSISLAGAEAGVICPDGFTANFNNSNRVLRCSKRVTANDEIRKSVCPIDINPFRWRYNPPRAGIDTCTDDNAKVVDTVPENTFDPLNYPRDPDGAAGLRDRFIKRGQTTTEFAFPKAVKL